jgi:hypothetical protein
MASKSLSNLQSAEQNNPIGETWHPNHLAICKVQNKTTQFPGGLNPQQIDSLTTVGNAS